MGLRGEILVNPTINSSCDVSSISVALQALNVSVADVQSAINSTALTGNDTVFKTSLDLHPEDTGLVRLPGSLHIIINFNCYG